MVSTYIKSGSRIDNDVWIVIISVNKRQVWILLPVIMKNLVMPTVDQDIPIQPNKTGLVMYRSIYIY